MKFSFAALTLSAAAVSAVTVKCGSSCSNGQIGTVNFANSWAPVPDTCQSMYVSWPYCVYTNDAKGDTFTSATIYKTLDDNCTGDKGTAELAPDTCSGYGYWGRMVFHTS